MGRPYQPIAALFPHIGRHHLAELACLYLRPPEMHLDDRHALPGQHCAAIHAGLAGGASRLRVSNDASSLDQYPLPRRIDMEILLSDRSTTALDASIGAASSGYASWNLPSRWASHKCAKLLVQPMLSTAPSFFASST